eukprot:CAMPEP_0119050604 /NCGR_PEP_ID=MMETSP1177-20130426/70812_1 /TAXON_ID=2985 /ORGANISM="Ochromonas sp, Strain CCMP1899" /LENGTH=265 /DNA_ID=CAMNT_0007029193 /DNA_START=29 /DNA_END=823 /DNA_ORIENTATION=-
MALPVTLTTADLTKKYDKNKNDRRDSTVDGIVTEGSSIPDVNAGRADIDTLVDDDEVLRIVSAAADYTQSGISETIDGPMKKLEETNMEENNIVDGDEKPMDPAEQLQQRLETKYGRAKKVSQNTVRNGPRGGSEIGGVVFEVVDHVGRVRDIRKSKSSLPSPMQASTDTKLTSTYSEVGEGEGSVDTVAEALARLTSKARASDPFSLEGSRQQREREKERLPNSEKAVFVTNAWLRAMAENFPPNPFTGVVPYGGEEVDRAIEK